MGKKTERVNGVLLSELKVDVFEKAYALAASTRVETAKTELPGEGEAPLVERVKALVNYFRETSGKGRLGTCTVCKGDSDMALDWCPYCGETEEEDDAPESLPPPNAPVQPPVAASKPVRKLLPKPAAQAPQGSASLPTQGGSQGGAPKAPTRRRLGGTTAVSAPPVEVPATGEAVEEQAVGPVTTELSEVGGPAATAVSTELDDEDAAVLAAHSVRELDDALTHIDELKRVAAMNLWELGHEIRRILTENLWMLRRTKEGDRRWRTFKQFCSDELKFSYQHCHRLMEVAQAFTQEEMQSIGVSKCHLLLQVPEEKRAELTASVLSGTTKAELSNTIADMKGREKAAIQAKDPAVTLVPQRRSITVAVALECVEIPMRKRIDGRHSEKSERDSQNTFVPAMSITDDPHCEEILSNGVRVSYCVVKNRDGSLSLIINRERATDDDVFGTAEANIEEE